jgi:hypothetical protein
VVCFVAPANSTGTAHAAAPAFFHSMPAPSVNVSFRFGALDHVGSVAPLFSVPASFLTK